MNLSINVNKKSKWLFIAIFVVFLSGAISIGHPKPVSAAESWNAEEIIDDLVFTNKNTMSVVQIQDFLNSKVSTCDTNGTQQSEMNNSGVPDYNGNGSIQRWEWGKYKYNQTVFTCLKDYTENGLSAAQIIYNASQDFSINPQVLIVLLQKEQSLLTDTWPIGIQYRSATGYGCPDTAPCDSQYYGLTNQIRWSATMFHAIMIDSPTWSKKYYPYWATDPNTGTTGPRYVYYNPTASCGGSWLNIQNRATQALYNYTPYQPNSDALAASMGQTVNCGAYGNLNFYRYFTNWFGSTTNAHLNFKLIQVSGSPALYLQTSSGKYYIPSGAVMTAWGLDSLPIQQVSQVYLDSLASGPSVGNLLKDDWNNYFVVEGARLHYVRDVSYLSLWNIDPASAVQSLGLAYTLPGGSWLGRFTQDATQPTGSFWLIDKGKKHLISNNEMLYQWRYTPDQLTTVSATFLSLIPTDSGNVTPFATTGSADYVVDTGAKLTLSNSNIKNAYYGAQSPVTYDPITLSFLPTGSATQFVINSLTGQWFMLEGGNKHYIASGEMAYMWGKGSGPLTSISNGLISSLVSAGNLEPIVQTASPQAYWVVDGTKHQIIGASTISSWLRPGFTPPTYSTESLNLLASGTNATSTINAPGSPYYYVMDAGNKRYLPTANIRSGFGSTVTTISSTLMNTIPEGSFLSYIVKDTNGQAYLIMNNVSYLIDPTYYESWGVTNNVPVVDPTTVARYTVSGLSLGSYISINNVSYVMSGGRKMPITSNVDAYQPATLNQIALPSDYFATSSQVTYLAKSTDAQNNSVWLINNGKKYLFSSFSAYVSYGYLSRSVAMTSLTPEALALIPSAAETPGLFIRPANSWGIKFISFGTSLGFPDGDSLFNLLGSTPVLVVSDSIYNNFPLTGSVSRILKDDAGKIYLTENGTKRWITNSNAYNPYRGYPVTYLYGTTMSLIPDGPAIN